MWLRKTDSLSEKDINCDVQKFWCSCETPKIGTRGVFDSVACYFFLFICPSLIRGVFPCLIYSYFVIFDCLLLEICSFLKRKWGRGRASGDKDKVKSGWAFVYYLSVTIHLRYIPQVHHYQISRELGCCQKPTWNYLLHIGIVPQITGLPRCYLSIQCPFLQKRLGICCPSVLVGSLKEHNG